jgi:hypothetical protein
MEFFRKNSIVILRSLGALMLVIGFAVHFWSVPQKGLSANEKAAANVARMEAKVAGSSSKSKKITKNKSSDFLQKLKKTQAKQLQYLTILAMLFGVGFLGYSFVPKKEVDA